MKLTNDLEAGHLQNPADVAPPCPHIALWEMLEAQC